MVYFDEIVAFTTGGTKLLTDGTPTTMVDSNGSTLAIPQRLNDTAFKVIYRGRLNHSPISVVTIVFRCANPALGFAG